MDQYIYEILQKIFGAYALFLIIVGTLSNLASFYVCLKLKKISTFVFFAFLSISDIIALYYWNLTNFINIWFNIDFLNYNYWLCKFGSYYQFSSLQISAWILILMSVDHNLSIRIKHWRRVYFNNYRAMVTAFILVIFFMLLNSSILISFGHMVKINDTDIKVICFYSEKYPSTRWMEQWGKAHLMLYSIIPFILLGISNVFLLRKAFESFRHKSKSNPISNPKLRASSLPTPNQIYQHVHKNHHHHQIHNYLSSRSSSFARSIVFNNLFFFIMTLPTALVSFYFENLFRSKAGRILIIFSNSISFSYHALHFFINFFTNKKFKSKTCEIFHQKGV